MCYTPVKVPHDVLHTSQRNLNRRASCTTHFRNSLTGAVPRTLVWPSRFTLQWKEHTDCADFEQRQRTLSVRNVNYEVRQRLWLMHTSDFRRKKISFMKMPTFLCFIWKNLIKKCFSKPIRLHYEHSETRGRSSDSFFGFLRVQSCRWESCLTLGCLFSTFLCETKQIKVALKPGQVFNEETKQLV